MAQKVVIIGGGPAGLMAAERLASAGAGFDVTLYDAMPSVGRKFLLAGAHGGLNLTHSEPLEPFIARYGEAVQAMEACLRAFTPDNLRQWCHGLGQETFIGSSGRVFPVGMSAKGLLRAWLKRLDDLGVKIVPRHRWMGWNKLGELVFQTPNAVVDVPYDVVLLALGGASWPRTGSNGQWVDIPQRKGIVLAALKPSNCGFVVPWSSHISHRFAGTPLKPVVVGIDGTAIQGEVMITKDGVEGGVIYALSGKIRKAIETTGQAIINLDLRPGLPDEGLALRLKLPRKALSFSNYLRKAAGLSPLAIALLRETTPPESLPINDVDALAKLIKKVPLRLTRPGEIDRAISTAGGVAFDALDAFFMLRDMPGVFVAGEMMDWDAPTGGYLMQGCFSSAVWAANGIMKFLGK